MWKDLQKSNKITKKLCLISKLITLSFITFITLALWQPITAICKFVRDGKYETSEGDTKVQCRKEKRYTDLAASRGELIEVSIEAVFEPMVQGKDFSRYSCLYFGSCIPEFLQDTLSSLRSSASSKGWLNQLKSTKMVSKSISAFQASNQPN